MRKDFLINHNFGLLYFKKIAAQIILSRFAKFNLRDGNYFHINRIELGTLHINLFVIEPNN